MRVGLAGAGHWHAAMHIDAAVAAGAKMVGAWDPQGRTAAAERAAVSVCQSLDELLRQRPDLICVMGHPADVPEITRACIDAGVPILLEKPAAATTATLAMLADHAAQAGHFVAVPFANRASPIWSEMDRLRAAGRLGAISHAQFRIINGPPSRYRADGVGWLLDPAVAGGGALRNLGLHAIDAALLLCGESTPVVVAAEIRTGLFGEAVEDYAVATLAVSGGPVITVEAGTTFPSLAPGGDFEWRVSTTNAYLKDCGDTSRTVTLDDAARRELPAVPPGLRYRAFMADTIERLQRGAAPAVGLADYLRAMRVVDRIYAVAGR